MATWKHRLSNINREARTADCAECGPNVKIKVRKQGQRCYTATLSESKGVGRDKPAPVGPCELCGTVETLARHHYHGCCNTSADKACRRCDVGLLCRACNLGLGLFMDALTYCAVLPSGRNEPSTK
jgi:hypothetical protein